MLEQIAPVTYSTVNRCVHGGKHGDFDWPFNVPDSAFGPWSPRCKSEILDPTAPCKPYVPGKPCNFKELAYLFSSVLHAVVTLCHDIPPAGDPGRPEWMDPRLEDIDKWLDFDWMGCFDSVSAELQRGIREYLFVILKETTLRQNYVYFVKYPELAAALKSIFDSFDGCAWLEFDRKIRKVTDLILEYGRNKGQLSYMLEVQITNTLDMSWVEDNNKEVTRLKDYSLTVATEIVAKKLTLVETLKQYSQTDGVLMFEIIAKNCSGNIKYNLRYGLQKFNVNTSDDFLTVTKSVFGS